MSARRHAPQEPSAARGLQQSRQVVRSGAHPRLMRFRQVIQRATHPATRSALPVQMHLEAAVQVRSLPPPLLLHVLPRRTPPLRCKSFHQQLLRSMALQQLPLLAFLASFGRDIVRGKRQRLPCRLVGCCNLQSKRFVATPLEVILRAVETTGCICSDVQGIVGVWRVVTPPLVVRAVRTRLRECDPAFTPLRIRLWPGTGC